MFYRTDEPHGLPHNPFTACITPRPIGWISTVDAERRVNLAPFSFFNGALSNPPMVMFVNASGPDRDGRITKDTLANVRATGEFVVNVATYDLREAMNLTAAHVPPEVDELAMAGLTAVPSRLVDPPRVAESPINMECRVFQIVDLPNPQGSEQNAVVIGHVLAMHIDESVLCDGLVDVARLKPLARMGYRDYTTVTEVFAMARPPRHRQAGCCNS
jgi:flavin reductase (DIM6/NTAB) family NADH-FMN oxidoreductase RutF